MRMLFTPPPRVLVMYPAISGWPERVCAVPHSTLKRPSSNEAVMLGAGLCAAGPAQASRSRARRSAASDLLAAGTLLPRHDADPIGGAGGADGLLEIHVVEAADEAGDEAHALRGDLALRI